MKIKNFVDQVRQEMTKVTWPTKKEVTNSTIIVMVMVSIASIFFLVLDLVIHNIVQMILSL